MDAMRQSAYLVVSTITVDTYGFLFNCTTVGQASDLMMAPGGWCLSLAGPTVAQLGDFCSSGYLLVMSLFLCIIIVC